MKKKCPKCGFENPADYILCENCRTALPDVTMAGTHGAAGAPAGGVCPSCGKSTDPGASFCRNCGGRLAAPEIPAQQPHIQPVQQSYSQPIYASPVAPRSRSSLWIFVALAVIAGLGVGAFVAYRSQQKSRVETASTSTSAASTPAVTPVPPATSTPVTDVPAETKTNDKPAEPKDESPRPARRKTSTKATAATNKEALDRPPQLITDPQTPSSPLPPAAQPPAGSSSGTPPQNASSNTATPSNPGRRRAVQETEGESSPLPSGAPPATNAPPVTSAAAQTQATAEQQSPTTSQSPISSPNIPAPARRAYNGPLSGIATWTGKLDKNDTLTITGGTPSTGILAGAPLPGVPIRITIDQSNMGFGEMPNASNGYRRLVLRSHSKHDKITIRWSVLQ